MSLRLGWVPILLALGSSALAADPRRLNIILIVVDDLGWADLGCSGSTFYETPNIDRLARRGVRFTAAYAASPVCSPSRAALMTGKAPARLHLTDWLPGRADRPSQKLLRPVILQHLPREEITLAETLKKVGYLSVSIGKWHLGGPEYWPEQQGFARNIGGTETGSPPGGYFRFHAPNLAAQNDQEYLTDRLTDESLDVLTEHKDRPFFLYLAHYAVHIPLQAKSALENRYRAKPAGDSPQRNAIYAAMIQSVDEGVGKILDRLDALGIADRTAILFTSDNGGLSVREGPNTPPTSNSPLRAGKGYLYEGGIRVPLIVAWPGVARPGSVCDTPVIGQDLYPTILSMADVKTAHGQVIDGVDRSHLLRGEPMHPRDALYWHYPHYSNQGGRPGGAIRRRDLKLIEWYETSQTELYDLSRDPGEEHDLAAERPEDAAQLRAQLTGWRQSVGAQMPTPNPDYEAAKP
jgi:arylsulfatase A-like enzyme